jgi:hypothetical protein
MLLLQIESIADALNSSEWVFPIAECFHIAAFAWSIGLIAAVDYRLLGFGIQHSKPSEVLHDTAPWTLLGLAVVLLSARFCSFPTRACTCTIRRSYLRCTRWAAILFQLHDSSQGGPVGQFVAGCPRGGLRCFSGIVDQRRFRRVVYRVRVSVF